MNCLKSFMQRLRYTYFLFWAFFLYFKLSKLRYHEHLDSQVIEELAKFDMLLKLKRGNKEEKFKVEVHKKLEGTFDLNHVQQEH